MISVVSELFIHLRNRPVIALRAFEGYGETPTNGKLFEPNEDNISWAFGRHPIYCDVVLESAYVSAIHFMVMYDRSLNAWAIQDGGYYPRPLIDRKTQEIYRQPGYASSGDGTYVNGFRLEHDEIKPTLPLRPKKIFLYPGDGIYAAGHKMIVWDSAQLPVAVNWDRQWKYKNPSQSVAVPQKQQKELMEQQKRKIEYEANSWGTVQKFMDSWLNLSGFKFYAVLIAVAFSAIVVAIIVSSK